MNLPDRGHDNNNHNHRGYHDVRDRSMNRNDGRSRDNKNSQYDGRYRDEHDRNEWKCLEVR